MYVIVTKNFDDKRYYIADNKITSHVSHATIFPSKIQADAKAKLYSERHGVNAVVQET